MKEKKFSLFNASRWAEKRPACCDVVPVLYAGDFSTNVIDELLHELSTTGSVAAPGFMKPEGVVIYMPTSRSLFKITLEGDAHKGTQKDV